LTAHEHKADVPGPKLLVFWKVWRNQSGLCGGWLSQVGQGRPRGPSWTVAKRGVLGTRPCRGAGMYRGAV